MTDELRREVPRTGGDFPLINGIEGDGMNHWDREREEYLLSKRDSQEAAAIMFVLIVTAALVALCVEVWGRVFP
jgi:hypothetical protein